MRVHVWGTPGVTSVTDGIRPGGGILIDGDGFGSTASIAVDSVNIPPPCRAQIVAMHHPMSIMPWSFRHPAR